MRTTYCALRLNGRCDWTFRVNRYSPCPTHRINLRCRQRPECTRQLPAQFVELLDGRVKLSRDNSLRVDFIKEMQRFLLPGLARQTVENGDFWVYLRDAVVEEGERVLRFLRRGGSASHNFEM